MTSKNVKCALAIIILAMIMVMPGKAFAGVKEVKVTGVYLLGEVETPVLGKERATREALRQAAEQVGVYITSSSQLRNNVITQDDVTAVSAAVLRVKNKTFLDPVIEEKDGELLTRIAVDLVVAYDTDLVDSVLRNEVEIRTIRKLYIALEKDFTDCDKKLVQIKSELKREGVKKQNMQQRLLNWKRIMLLSH